MALLQTSRPTVNTIPPSELEAGTPGLMSRRITAKYSDVQNGENTIMWNERFTRSTPCAGTKSGMTSRRSDADFNRSIPPETAGVDKTTPDSGRTGEVPDEPVRHNNWSGVRRRARSPNKVRSLKNLSQREAAWRSTLLF
jgi:hypothetical protein